jgi:hypothetical protein
MQELRVTLENGDLIRAVIKEHAQMFFLDEQRVIAGTPTGFSNTHPRFAAPGSCFDLFVTIALAFASDRKSEIAYFDNPKGTPLVSREEQMVRRRGPAIIRVDGQ